MNRDQMKAWRDYFVSEMHDRLGMEAYEAQKTVARWLRSLPRNGASGWVPPARSSSDRSLHSSTANQSRASRT
jgi:hypothetical protein